MRGLLNGLVMFAKGHNLRIVMGVLDVQGVSQ